MSRPPDAPPPRGGTGADDKILLGGGDHDDVTSTASILADLHERFDGLKVPGWNEARRHEAEFRAWRAGAKRICDLVGAGA